MKRVYYLIVCMVLMSAGRGWAQEAATNNADTFPAADSLLADDKPNTQLFDRDRGNPDLQVEASSYVSGDRLMATPGAFLNSAITGRLSGLFSRQSSGLPGADGAGVSLRGRNPRIVVDGIPRTLPPWSINPEQIESVTVLKGALSSAFLGMQGLDGAVLITTKKGSREPGFSVDVTAQGGVSQSLQVPSPLAAGDYAQLYNEAMMNDGRDPLFAPEDIAAYRNHSNPFTHPDINWYDRILNDQTSFNRYTLNAEGNARVVNYFVSLDYLDQNGLFKASDENSYSTNAEYQRYIFRSNVRVDLTQQVELSANLFGRIREENNPGGGAGSIFNALLTTPAPAYPVFNPDSSLGGNIDYQNNIYAQSVRSGYTQDVFSDGYADISLQRDMSDVLDGWWVKGTMSYILTVNQMIDRTKNFEVFQLNRAEDGTESYQRFGNQTEQNNLSRVTTRQHQTYFDIRTGYTQSWGDNGLDIIVMFNRDHDMSNVGLGGQFNTLAGNFKYSIQDKYILQAVLSYAGNSRYAPGNRFGFFPAGGVAWNIHNEDFFNKEGFLNFMKLRGTYGLLGNAVAGNYSYIDRYNNGAAAYFFGASPSRHMGIAEAIPKNVHTWAKGRKLDVGLDLRFAGHKGMLSVDYYHNYLYDTQQARGRSSALIGFGSGLVENLGERLFTGLEFSAGWSGQAGDFGYFANGNLSFSQSEVLNNDEPDYPYAWMQREGHPEGQPYGYVSDGFVSQAGQGMVMEGYTAVPGDLQYKDLNGDGTINQFDQRSIGTEKPLMFYGLDLGFSWRRLSLSLLIQGVGNRDILLTGPAEWEFQNNGKGQAWAHHLNRWTPQTAATATYPRLTVGTNFNNHVNSDFWLHSGDYLRLKNAELAYSFNDIDMGKVQIRRLRVFINGYNLLTSSDFKRSDPEVMPGAYPNQRIINGGLNLKF